MTFPLALALLSADPVSGDSIIHAPALGAVIVIKTSSRTAGAIESVTWNDKSSSIGPITGASFNPRRISTTGQTSSPRSSTLPRPAR
jgi:hypothetical protein